MSQFDGQPIFVLATALFDALDNQRKADRSKPVAFIKETYSPSLLQTLETGESWYGSPRSMLLPQGVVAKLVPDDCGKPMVKVSVRTSGSESLASFLLDTEAVLNILHPGLAVCG